MDLELGLTLRRVADEFCSADFQFSKDRTGPVFISTETESLFFLTAHLKGHRKQNIKIEINEDGTRIIISGEMAIQETVMVEWRLYRKETEIRRFRKAFKIPDGVILDKIKAKYNEDECILTISMPKKDKGIRGFNIEEVQEQELAREGSETLEIVPDEVPKQENEMQEKDQGAEAEHAEGSGLAEEEYSGVPEIATSEEPKELAEEEYSEVPEIATSEEPKEAGFDVAPPEETQVAEVHDMKKEEMKEHQLDQNERLKKPSEDHEGTVEEAKSSPDVANGEESGKSPASHLTTGETSQRESVMQAQELEKEEKSQGIEGDMERKHEQPEPLTEVIDQNHHKRDQVDGKESGTQEEEEEEESALVKPPDKVQEDRQSRIEKHRGRCKMCAPILAGSALLLSLVVFVIQFIRKKSHQGKKKE
ncbi:cilia- and flagella-associated protein 251 [Coffea eugenioides]|uniref:cilia- and flagella-associated protein 251 n=1 Tax=Coffea eugenioides TaxID=49369 RepID=UPI000F610085|nr:cilia- and flagella-associated protein 251 [Coffea eugenioides]